MLVNNDDDNDDAFGWNSLLKDTFMIYPHSGNIFGNSN